MVSRDEHDRRVRAACDGDREAFTALVRVYWDRIYRWLCGMLHHPQTAEDLTQETFLKAWKALGSFRPGTDFRAWLFRIAGNGMISSLRRRREAALPESFESPAPCGSDPVRSAARRELAVALERAVRELPARFRGPLLLRTQEGMEFADIAAALNLTVETVRWRVFMARRRLLRATAAHRDEEPV